MQEIGDMRGIIQFFGELLKSNSLLAGPKWFTETGLYFEAVFILVAMLVSLVSYKAYKLTKEKKFFFFSSAFGFFTLSFLTKFIANYLKLNQTQANLSQAVMPAMSSSTFFHFGRLLYVFFCTACTNNNYALFNENTQKKTSSIFYSFTRRTITCNT